MRKKLASGICITILSLLSACSAPAKTPDLPTATASPTVTPTIEATRAITQPAPNMGPYADSSATGNEPGPVIASTPETQVQNQAFFQDHLATADMFVANVNVEPAPANQVYQGWIVNEDGSSINVGVLEIQADGTIHIEWTAPDSRNLIASVTGFQITLEEAPGSALPTGKVRYAGEMGAEQIALARSLFVSNTGEPVTPRNKAFAPALVQQMSLAGEHIKNAINAEAIGATSERILHLEHVINILEGAKGTRFKDYNGNGVAENPGDGFGVIAYATQLAAKLDQESITKTTVALQTALEEIEQEIIALLDSQTGTVSLSSLQTQFTEINQNLVINLYSQSEQAVAFKINPVPAP